MLEDNLDGLMNRFLVISPKPEITKFKDLCATPPPALLLDELLYRVHLHSSDSQLVCYCLFLRCSRLFQVEYKLEPEAENLFGLFYDTMSEYCVDLDHNDTKSGMIERIEM